MLTPTSDIKNAEAELAQALASNVTQSPKPATSPLNIAISNEGSAERVDKPITRKTVKSPHRKHRYQESGSKRRFRDDGWLHKTE